MSFKRGDIVRAAQTIRAGNLSVRIGSQGLVKNVIRKGLSKHYEVVWPNVTLTVASHLIVPTGVKGRFTN